MAGSVTTENVVKLGLIHLFWSYAVPQLLQLVHIFLVLTKCHLVEILHERVKVVDDHVTGVEEVGNCSRISPSQIPGARS